MQSRPKSDHVNGAVGRLYVRGGWLLQVCDAGIVAAQKRVCTYVCVLQICVCSIAALLHLRSLHHKRRPSKEVGLLQ
jgi:hypothetical protein